MTIISSAAVGASSSLIDITAHASANTKGAWTEVIAAASHTATTYWMTVEFEGGNTAAIRSFLIDIGTGAGGAETAVVSNIPWNDKGSSSGDITFPITIASGTRISARCQATTGSAVCRIMVRAMTDNQWGTSTSNESTASTTTSRGAAIDPGGVANTKGSYTELIASTGINYDYWVVVLGLNNNDSVGATSNSLIDIATGAGGAETVLVPDIFFRHSVAENDYVTLAFWHQIASGTRLSARSQSTDTDAADRISSVSVQGFAMTAPSGGGGLMRNPVITKGGMV